MIVRPAVKEDWDELVIINHTHDFPFPDFKNMLDVLVVERDGKIVAWGYTKKYVEIVFIPKRDSPKSTIVKSLKLLSDMSTELTKARGIDQVHSYVTDEHFARLLVERFNYGVCTGTPLFLNLDDTNGEIR
jgi:hypothetical protein